MKFTIFKDLVQKTVFVYWQKRQQCKRVKVEYLEDRKNSTENRRKEETTIAGLIGALSSILEHCLSCTSIYFRKDNLKQRKGKMKMLMPKESSL